MTAPGGVGRWIKPIGDVRYYPADMEGNLLSSEGSYLGDVTAGQLTLDNYLNLRESNGRFAGRLPLDLTAEAYVYANGTVYHHYDTPLDWLNNGRYRTTYHTVSGEATLTFPDGSTMTHSMDRLGAVPTGHQLWYDPSRNDDTRFVSIELRGITANQLQQLSSQGYRPATPEEVAARTLQFSIMHDPAVQEAVQQYIEEHGDELPDELRDTYAFMWMLAQSGASDLQAGRGMLVNAGFNWASGIDQGETP